VKTLEVESINETKEKLYMIESQKKETPQLGKISEEN
jgi:hypothetical protein